MATKVSDIMIETPKVPNYVFISGTKNKIPITMLSDEDCENLSIAWRDALKARKRVMEKERGEG